MTNNTFRVIDIGDLKDEFDKLSTEIRSFFESSDFPSVKAQLIRYINMCNRLEGDAISLRSEISLTHAEAYSDYMNNIKTAYSDASQWDSIQRWQSDIVVHGESSVRDSKMVVDKLESMLKSLEDFKWLFKSNREAAVNFYKFLSGDE